MATTDARADRTVRSRLIPHLTPGRAYLGRTTDLFLRGLGLVYLAAMLSLWSQIDGLIGSAGILPAGAWAQWVKDSVPPPVWAKVPSLVLLDPSDGMLHLLCASGAIGAVLMVFGILPIVSAAVCWVVYLSLVLAGQVFLGYQWDQLLLEAGFLAIFLAPAVVRSSSHRAREPSRMFVWLGRWLVFRLMFVSGFVKLASGDPAWSGLTALSYHYFTQPIPTWTAWGMHQLPDWVHRACTAVVLLVELVLPFLIFGPRRARFMAFCGLAGLQVLILLTGNFGFFNLLSILLCLLLLDDRHLFRRELRQEVMPAFSRNRWSYLIRVPVALLLLVASTLGFSRQVLPGLPWPDALRAVAAEAAAFRITSTYGLFAVMTVKRPELIIEGSDDGATWRPYVFPWNPGPTDRRPGFATPHMPRADWQLWFAALGEPEGNLWVFLMMSRFLEGSPPALALLEENPFPERPPRQIRAVRYAYTFSEPRTLRDTGDWWIRERTGPYGPILERP